MNKTLLFFLLLFQGFVALTQSRTAIFEGRNVKVFPYKLENEFSVENYYEYFNKSIFNEFAIPYVPDNLEDGEYAIYYAEEYYSVTIQKDKRGKNKIIEQLDSFTVAAIFNIKNNRKEGPVLFYAYNNQKKPIVTGFYKNDLKDSVWETRNEKEKFSVEYKAGMIDGKVIRENLKYKVQRVAVFKNGLEMDANNQFGGDKTIYQGREVSVCKYRIKFGEEYESGEYYRESKDSSLISGWEALNSFSKRLEDGEYIVYYKPEIKMDVEQLLKLMAKQKSLSVAVNFSVKNGKLEGSLNKFEFGKQNLASKNNKKASVFAVYKDGKLEGDLIRMDEIYKVKSITTYRDGKLHGKELYYYNGKLQTLRNWKNGKQDGKEENYNHGKLIKMITWKDGSCYGPYVNNENRWCSKKGFYLSANVDSVVEITCKNKSHQIITYSLTPFAEMDTTELAWYLSPVNLYQNGKASFVKYQEVGLNGKPLFTHYFYKGCRQIPFVLLNAHGDTIQIAKRISSLAEPYKSKWVTRIYNKKNVLTDEIEEVYNLIETTTISRHYYSTKVSTIQYSPDLIKKQYYLNRPVSSWNGWMEKTDSTIIIERKLFKNESKISETLRIKNLVWLGGVHDFNGYEFTRYFEDNEKRQYRFIPKDTVLVEVTKEVFKGLEYSYQYKKCLTDSVIVSDLGNAQFVNPYELNSYAGQLSELTGKNRLLMKYRDKPYTGKIIVNEVYSEKGDHNRYRGELAEKDGNLIITKYESLHVKYEREERYDKFKLRNFEFNYSNGILNGIQKGWASNGDSIYLLNYKDGLSEGQQNFINVTYTKKYPASSNMIPNFTHVNVQYDSGRMNGNYISKDYRGNPILVKAYKNGKLDGSYLENDKLTDQNNWKTQPLIKANFENDSLDGDLIIYNNGIEKERITFVKGLATGNYYKYAVQSIDRQHSDSAHKFQPYNKVYLYTKTMLFKGHIKDTAFAFFADGGINYIAVMDTDFHHRFIYQKNAKDGKYVQKDAAYTPELNYRYDQYRTRIISRMGSVSYLYFGADNTQNTGIDLDPLYNNAKANFTLYYKNGIKAQQGKMVNASKYGYWKYWSENGVLMKEVDYKKWLDTGIHYPANYAGKITTYYPSGKKLMEGYITSQELSYQCNQELEIAYENVSYTHYYNEQGKDIFNNGNCKVTEFHIDGTKRYNGQLTNGQNSGLWKYYDPTGNLSAFGEYVNGQKHGRWLSGDLGGINYIDNACSINEALSLIKERKLQNIDITETIYEMGIEVSSSHLVLEKF